MWLGMIKNKENIKCMYLVVISLKDNWHLKKNYGNLFIPYVCVKFLTIVRKGQNENILALHWSNTISDDRLNIVVCQPPKHYQFLFLKLCVSKVAWITISKH